MLDGHAYDLMWIAPGYLASAKLKLTGTCDLRAPAGGLPAIYGDHVDPLYNIHCELALTEDGPPEGTTWPAYWRGLAAGLDGAVPCFAVAAYSDGKLAGQVRFFPRSRAHLRAGAPEFGGRKDENSLLIGAGAVDLLGAQDGLDVTLLRRVADYARRAGYARVRAIGWSNVRPYAMWGESLPVAATRRPGSRAWATLTGPPRARSTTCWPAATGRTCSGWFARHWLTAFPTKTPTGSTWWNWIWLKVCREEQVQRRRRR